MLHYVLRTRKYMKTLTSFFPTSYSKGCVVGAFAVEGHCLFISCRFQPGTWAVISALKSLPWLGTRRCKSSCAMTKFWKLNSLSARSYARVTIPDVEHEPHFCVMCLTRTSRGRTCRRRAQYSTRVRITSRRSSRVRTGAFVQKNGENELHDAAPFLLVQF